MYSQTTLQCHIVNNYKQSVLQVCDNIYQCPKSERGEGGEDETLYCPDNHEGSGLSSDELDEVPREDWCFSTLTIKCTCRIGWAGNGEECGRDTDLDGYPDNELSCVDQLAATRFAIVAGGDAERCRADNCPLVPNSGQEDADKDGIGDRCDDDNDNDGKKNKDDNCPNVHNPDQADRDRDKIGDVCDLCPDVHNDGHDTDGDGKADACDEDIDGDGRDNERDNCPKHKNPDQKDSDGDGLGDVCDNCPDDKNENQDDDNENGIGNVCDGGHDSDKDGIPDDQDNCPNEPNNDQNDIDNDKRGDVCDDDKDGDGVPDDGDNCPLKYNPGQKDDNGKFSITCYFISFLY